MPAQSMQGSFVWWSKTTRDARRLAERRALPERCMMRKSVLGSFTWWRTTVHQMRARTLALRLFDKAFSHWARKSSTTAFLWWRRFTAIARDAAATRACDSSKLHKRPPTRNTARPSLDDRGAALGQDVRRQVSFEWWHRARRCESRRGPKISRDATVTTILHVVGPTVVRGGLFVVAKGD